MVVGWSRLAIQPSVVISQTIQSFDLWPLPPSVVCNQGNHSVVNVLFFQWHTCCKCVQGMVPYIFYEAILIIQLCTSGTFLLAGRNTWCNRWTNVDSTNINSCLDWTSIRYLWTMEWHIDRDWIDRCRVPIIESPSEGGDYWESSLPCNFAVYGNVGYCNLDIFRGSQSFNYREGSIGQPPNNRS